MDTAAQITSKENMLRIFRREKPMWLDSDVNYIWPRIIPDNIARGMVRDARPFDPVREGGGKDWLGVDWVYEPQNRGSMVIPGNPKVTDILEWEKVVTLPDLDALDWEASARENAHLLDPNRMTGSTIFTGLFERLISLMDFSNAAVALIDEEEQEGVHRLFDALATFYDKLIGKLQQYFHIDLLEFHDDWGAQRSAFFSVDTCREMLLPYVKRVVESCHSRGILFRMHSCGKIETLVPVMIEAGMDNWGGQPINDKWKLYEMYGDQMLFSVTFESLREEKDEKVLADVVDEQLSRLIPGRNILLDCFRNEPLRRLIVEKSRPLFA